MADRWVQTAQLTTCDACGHQWRPRIRVKTDRLLGESWVFRCERCQRRYDMVTISARGVEVRAEIDALREDPLMLSEEREQRMALLMEELERETTRGAAAGVGPSLATMQEAQRLAIEEGADGDGD